MLLLSIILTFLFLPQPTFAAFMIQKYAVDVESGYLCPDNDQLEAPMTLYRVDRLNRTHRAFTMAFSFAHPVDNTVEGTIITEKEANGGWTKLPVFSYQQDPCNKIMKGAIQSSKDLWVKFGKAAGFKHPEKCDIPAGNYSLNKFPIEIDGELPFWGGRFRFTVVLRRIKAKKKLWCTITLVNFREVN